MRNKREPFDPMAYARYLNSTGEYGKMNGELFHWNGMYWEMISSSQVRVAALQWYDAHSDAIFGSKHAAHAADSATDAAPPLKGDQHHELLIPLRNGYLHYEAGAFVLKPHDKALCVRYLIDCEYDRAASKPKLFTAFIERILPDAAVRGRVQEYMGYTLLGDARFQRGQLWKGGGANGKGVLANILQAFHRSVATLNLAETDGFNLSHLPGASLVYVDEVPNTKINDDVLKRLIAGENSPIRRHYRPTVNVRVLAKWLVLSNNIPKVEDQSDGFWRRFDMVPFDVTIPETERDPQLAEKIIAGEMTGVLNWLLEGLSRLLARGRFDPVKPKAIQALDNYARVRADSVRGWVDEEDVSLGTTCSTHKDEVYQAYANWARRNGMVAQSAPRFWSSLASVLPGLVQDGRFFKSGRRLRACNVILADLR